MKAMCATNFTDSAVGGDVLLSRALRPVHQVAPSAVLEGQREVEGAAPVMGAAPVRAQLRRRRLSEYHVANVDQLEQDKGKGEGECKISLSLNRMSIISS